MNSKVPHFLIKMLENQYEKEIINKIINGYTYRRVVTFRVNTIKSDSLEIKKVLSQSNIKYEKVDWYKDAFIIEDITEKDIMELEIYKEGKIYLQSLSSMLPSLILDPKEGEDILDMTAAPGGKTTQIAALTNNKANITACEMNKIRLERLKYNIDKQGASSVYVMQKDSRNIDDFFSFDRILLDAPCSGSGTLNIDNNIEKYFTENLIEKSVKTQESLLNKAIKILKPGHTMVYSTCSILDVENENIIKKALDQHKIEIIPIEFKNIDKLPLLPTKIGGAICIMPNELYEGFFVCKIKKL